MGVAVASSEGVIRAFFPGAVRGTKSGRTLVLYRCTGSQHGAATLRKVDAAVDAPEFSDRREGRVRMRSIGQHPTHKLRFTLD